MNDVPEIEIVAIRTADAGGHVHVATVQLLDGTVESAADVLAKIEAHEAHYFIRPPADHPAWQAKPDDYDSDDLKMLVRVTQCPDCAEQVLIA